MRLLLFASTSALILGAAPIGDFVAPAQAQVGVAISATIAPPLLPIYAQPPIPGPGYLWIPGYWAWNGEEYYWVPGYWTMPPSVGLYWTPPYWAWVNGAYLFNAGYWGPTVGFYGGIAYGFGYPGAGFYGGFWQNNVFVYNRTVNNFGAINIANSFSRPVFTPNNHVAFNGGRGGTTARPTQAQIAARSNGTPPTAAQAQHQQMARGDPAMRFSANHGSPATMAVQRAGELHGAGAAPAATSAPTERPQAAAPAPPVRPQANGHASATQGAAARPQLAQHAPIARYHYAYHAPAHQHFAYQAPIRRAPFMPQHFAYHAPAMHMGGMRMGGGMHAGGAVHVGGGARRVP
jgi:hypothetical protein